MRYDAGVALLACPFCREMYSTAEAEICPMCALPLTAVHKLPRADGFDPTDLEAAVADDDLRVPFASIARGRGPLALAGVFGITLFFLPWIDLTFPMTDQLSGFDLAQRLGWTWAVPAAWFVLIPTVLSRRTARKMQSARVAIGMLAFFPGLAAFTLWMRPPRGAYGLRLEYSFLWPMLGTIALSALTIVVGAFFGLTWRRQRSAEDPEPAPLTPEPATVKQKVRH